MMDAPGYGAVLVLCIGWMLVGVVLVLLVALAVNTGSDKEAR